MKIKSLLVACVIVTTGLPSFAKADAEAEALVLSVSNRVLDVIREGRATYDDDPSVLQGKVLAILDPATDFESFARGVMGRHFAGATPEQKTKFKAAFKDTLAELYTSSLVQTEVTDIKVNETVSKAPGRATVSTRVGTLADGSFTVQYTMRQSEGGEWKARNMIIDGVNVGLTYRSQFDSAVQASGGDLDVVVTDWTELID